MLGDIEGSIRQPTASPQEVLDIVRNISSPSSASDNPPTLVGVLSEQLHKVAESHGGRVPLHGRLFAQWMHYAYPRECPFPHKAGAFAQHTLTPGAFGGGYIASKDEMEEHASVSLDDASSDVNEDWMTQWSEEEELFANYKMQAPWERGQGISAGILFMIAVVVLIAWGVVGGNNKGSTKFGTSLPTFATKHSHFV